MKGFPSWGKHPFSHTLLPSWLQCCDLLVAPPHQGPWQEFKHPQEKPPAIDPGVRLPELLWAFIREPGRQGRSSPFFLPFFCLLSHPPRLGPPLLRSLRELRELLSAEVEPSFVCCPFPVDPYQGRRPGGGAGHFGPQAFEQIFGS